MPVPISYEGFKKVLQQAGARKLSELEIDVDKDWGGHVIKNLGSPTATGDAVPLGYLKFPYDYLIYTDGTSFYAYNGKTNKIDYEGTDAYTVIQSALDALTSGGKVYIAPGTYPISNHIEVPSNILLEGAGWSTIIEGNTTDGYTVRAMGTSNSYKENVIIRNLHVKVNATDADGITMYFARRYLIEGCYIEGSGEEGIEQIAVEDGIVRNNVIEGMGTGANAAIDVYFDAPTGKTSGRVVIEGNIVKNCGSWGIHVGGGTKGCVIRGNTLHYPGGEGIYIEAGGGMNIEDVIVSGNEVVLPGGVGVYIRSRDADTIHGHIIISGNRFEGDGDRLKNGILVHGVDRLNIIGNHISSAKYSGIEVGKDDSGTNYSFHVNIQGNTIIGCGGDGVRISGAHRTIVKGNASCGNSGYGVNETDGDLNVIAGNVFIGDSAGKTATVGTNTLVTDNV
ncbi:MAG: hypothetical protein DRO09_02190 [Thermoprotei archaeon]|mgnify:CR=1 FL=1|nr:MAG: hypothetical protein DRO09_02190 [Thermoprotei archaeon]